MQTGHCCLNSHLHRMGLHPDGLWNTFPTLETVNDFLRQRTMLRNFAQENHIIIILFHQHQKQDMLQNTLYMSSNIYIYIKQVIAMIVDGHNRGHLETS